MRGRQRTDHVFVNNIRFIAMISIIGVHAHFLTYSEDPGFLPSIVLLQSLKFGTICFFMISGFLLGNQLLSRPPGEYMVRRVNSTFKPWLFWAGMFVLLLTFKDAVLGRLTATEIGSNVLHTLFYTNFWFVPNFLLALALLLTLRRWFDCWQLGMGLLCISLFYSANIYLHWIPTEHTTALFGFVFYLWLGVQANRHGAQLLSFVRRVPWLAVIVTVAGTWALALLEGLHVREYSPTDPLNTLRLSNQLFSLSVFALLLKFQRPLWPRWMNVRQHTYGLFLIHWLILMACINIIGVAGGTLTGVGYSEFSANTSNFISHPPVRLTVWAIVFVFVYSMSFLLTRFLAESKSWSWTVGTASTDHSAPLIPSKVRAQNFSGHD